MNSLIIGTAGHIDHGKSALIKALNGFDGDTLALEKQKGITIDLSFSHLRRGEKNIAFIDVPGHENLVKTMISGAFGFSACLFVVDINEGMKAQSIEHLQVLRLLDCKNIILILSKCDLCENLNERQSAILRQLEGFNLNFLGVFQTSIKDEKSIEKLKDFLFALSPAKADESAVFRYYIDRVFSLKGIGTVVTGSLNEGFVEGGEKIFCLDNAQNLLVKNVQIHDSNAPSASAYNRVALSLNCDYKELKKGYLLSKKGYFKGFAEADGVVLASELKHQSELLFCVGSRQVAAKVAILREFEGKFYVHFSFEKPLFLCFNERFILLENARLRGGGRILNPLSEPLKKEQKNKFLSLLERASEKLKNAENLGIESVNLKANLGKNLNNLNAKNTQNLNENSNANLKNLSTKNSENFDENLNNFNGKNGENSNENSNKNSSNLNSKNAQNLNKNLPQNKQKIQIFLEVFEFLKNTHKLGFGLLSSYQRFKLTHEQALQVAKALNNAFVDEKEMNVYDLSAVQNIKEFIRFVLAKNDYAMLSANFIATRLAWASEAFCEFVLDQMPAELDFEGGIYFKKGMNFEKLERKNHDALFAALKKEGIKPTAPYNLYDFLEIERSVGDKMLKKLTKNGLVLRLAHNLFIEKSALVGLESQCLKLLESQALDVQAMKAYFGLSRKYAIAYLEWLDKNEKITKVGEKRILRQNL